MNPLTLLVCRLMSSRVGRGSCRYLLAAALIGLSLPASFGQTSYSTGTLRGTVLDPQGASIANATLTVTNTATGVAETDTSSAAGAYQFLVLNPGTYDLQVVAQGFEKSIAKSLVITVGQIVVYDPHLKVGSTTVSVEVTYNSAPLIEVEQSQQANTINPQQVENLPNVSRSFTASIYTLPGVTNSNAPAIQDPNIGTGYLSSGFSIGGSTGRSNLFTIDGGENDYGSGALRVANVPVDSIQELQVNRNSFGAEFGFTSGTAINIVTKSGTNNYHGSAYGYFHDQSTDAANFFNSFSPDPTNKPFEQNAIFGGTFGGPIKKDKLFFFTSFEKQKLDNPVVTNLLGTAEAQGISAQPNGFNPGSGLCPNQIPPAGQAQLVTQACYLTQLATVGGPLAPLGAGLIASPVFNPLEDPILNALIAPNSGTFDGNTNVVQAPPNQNGRMNNWVSRVDFTPNEKNSFSLRFSLAHEQYTVTGPGGEQRPYSTTLQFRDYTLTGSWTHIINPNLVNTVRVQAVPHDTADNTAPNPGRAEIGLGSLGPVGTPFAYPYDATQNRFQFDESLSWVKGKHDFKFGGSYRPDQYKVFQQLWFGGQYNFLDGAIPLIDVVPAAFQPALAAYNALQGYPAGGPPSTNLTATESYVAGVPGSLLQANGNGQVNIWNQYLGIFAQDSWKVTHNLTMNYGLRFDYDHSANPVPSSAYVSPRLGFAWDPKGDGKTVVRAGGGLFVAPVIFLVPFYLNELGTNGQHTSLALQTLTGQPTQLLTATAIEQGLATLQNPNPALNATQLAAAGISIVPPGPAQQNGVFYTISNNFKPQYSIQSSLSIAREIARDLSVEVGYQYYRNVHIQQNLEANYVQDPTLPVDPFVGPFYMPKPGSTGSQPNTQILQNNQFASIGSGTYNGLTASLTKRFSHGLQFQANYTFSKAMDNTSDYSSLSTPFRPDLLAADRSLSDFNITNNFVANAVYTTPFHTDSGSFLAKAFANVSVSPIVYAHSGLPFTLLVPGISSTGIAPLTANGAGDHISEARPFNEGRNTGIGPGFVSWDMRISKAFYIKRESGMKLDVIAQATNLLNHTNFSAVNNIFPNTAVVTGGNGVTGGVTTSAEVATPEGIVNLLNGPYRFKGFVPTSADQLAGPLAFRSANPPRQLSLGLQFAF
jgi:Carboxypeptidase regulatory-like domain